MQDIIKKYLICLWIHLYALIPYLTYLLSTTDNWSVVSWQSSIYFNLSATVKGETFTELCKRVNRDSSKRKPYVLKWLWPWVLLIAEYTCCYGIAMWCNYSFYYNFDDINILLMSILHILYVWVSIVSICSEISCCYDYLCCHLFTFMLSEISSSSDKKAAGRWREPAGDELWEVSILIISFVVSVKTNVTMIFGFYAPLRIATPTVSVHFLRHIVKMN